ncbi:hypothetical protein, partial [Enterococcus faecalis]
LSRQDLALRGLDAVPRLRAQRVGGGRAVQDLWGAHADALGVLLPHPILPPATSVVPLPGADALALLAALGTADADVV